MKEELSDVQLMAKALDCLEVAVEGKLKGLPRAKLTTTIRQLKQRLVNVPDAYKTRPQLRIVVGMHGVVESHELQAADIALSLTASGHVNVYKNKFETIGYKTVDDALLMLRGIVNKYIKAQPEDLEEPGE